MTQPADDPQVEIDGAPAAKTTRASAIRGLRNAAIIALIWTQLWLIVFYSITVYELGFSGLRDYFGDASLYGLIFAAATVIYPLVLAMMVGDVRRTARWLSERTGDAISWAAFAGIVTVVPAFALVFTLGMDQSYASFSVLAQVNAALVIAVVINVRTSFSFSQGGDTRRLTGAKLGLLVLLALGTYLSVMAAILSNSTPPEGVSYDWTLNVALGYGLAAVVAALGILVLNGGMHILGLLDEEVSDGSRTTRSASHSDDGIERPLTPDG